MEESPSWEANSSSANQEVLRSLSKPKNHYRTHWSRQLFLSSTRSIQSTPSILFLYPFLHSRRCLGVLSGIFPSGFSIKTLYAPLRSPIAPKLEPLYRRGYPNKFILFSEHWGSFLEVKQPKREADQSPPYSAEAKNGWSYIYLPPPWFHGAERNRMFLLLLHNF
jgi:hypothetical protein